MIVLGSFSFDIGKVVTLGVKFHRDKSGELQGNLIVGLTTGADGIRDVSFTGTPQEIINSYVKVLSHTSSTDPGDIVKARDELFQSIVEDGGSLSAEEHEVRMTSQGEQHSQEEES